MIMSTLGNSEYIIHHPSKVEVYAVTREQLELLSRGAESDWKGRWQNSFSILLTCLINIIALGWNMENTSFRLNLGIGIGIIALIIGAISLKFYISDMRRHNMRLTEILKQPIQNTPIQEEQLK